VFGSAALTVFILQLVTGILLALIYVPSASEAWSKPASFEYDVDAGLVIPRCTDGAPTSWWSCPHPHGAGLPLRSVQIPRELTWIVGVFLLLMKLGMAFTDKCCFDQDAYWGLGIEFHASRVPIAGPIIREIDACGRLLPSDAVPIFRAACLRDIQEC